MTPSNGAYALEAHEGANEACLVPILKTKLVCDRF